MHAHFLVWQGQPDEQQPEQDSKGKHRVRHALRFGNDKSPITADLRVM